MTTTPASLVVRGPKPGDPSVRALAEALRAQLPAGAPYALWRSQDLTEAWSARRYSLPLLVLTRNGLWVVHVDDRSGAFRGDDTLWRVRPLHSAEKERISEAPFGAVRAKAEVLREALASAHTRGALERLPPVHTAVVLTGAAQVDRAFAALPDLFVGTDAHSAEQRLLDALTAGPERDEAIVRGGERDAIIAALQAAGLADSTSRLVKGYRLGELLEDHEIWQEHRATHTQDPARTARVRTWILPRGGSEAERATLARAVRTESRILGKLGRHPSILALLEVDDDGAPPRLLFEDFDGLPLDRFLRAHPDLPFNDRLAIVLAVGDALVHCHREDVCHRNLSPASVLARRAGDGVDIRLHRFEGALVESTHDTPQDTPQETSLGTSHPSAFGGRMEDLYRAPEVYQAAQDAETSADLFSLGALAWFLFTGKHPGPGLADRGRRILDDEGLRLWRELDGADDALDDLVAAATRLHPHERVFAGAPLTVPRLLDRLRQLYRDEREEPAPDPLLAGVGDVLATADGDLHVVGVLGTGATSRVLQVETSTGTAALKLPLAPRFAAHLDAEARALARLEHEHIVRLLGQPQLSAPQGPVTGLLLQFAGDQSLADRVRADGALSLDFCARLGEQLLSAVAHLHERGVGHRDLKPANLAFAGTGKQAHRLLVFDFSLAAIDRDDVGAGTRGWRDPFLGQNRWSWDDAADLYGAAACLYFALTGERPQVATRGEGQGRVRVEPLRFDATVRGGLAQFFNRAFAPDLAERHADADAMRHAWRALFEGDTTSVISDPGGAAPAEAADLRRRARLDTGVARLGLSARAVDGLERAGVFDVRDLLALPKNRLSTVRGVGADTRRHIQDAIHDLQQALGGRPDAAIEPLLGPLPGLPRALESVELPLDDEARTKLRDAGLRTTHDLALHGAQGIIRLLGLSKEGAGALRRALRATSPEHAVTGPIATWVRALLSPSAPSRRARWEDRLRMLTGLDPMVGETALAGPLGGRTTAAAAAACGDSAVAFRAAVHTAREHWRSERPLADAAVAAVLAALGGPAAPIERLARALLAAHAPAAPVDDDALRQAAALVRFATEVDLPTPPLAWQLVGGAAWVAADPRTLAALEHAAEALTLRVDPEVPTTGEAAARAVADHIAGTPLADVAVPLLLELLVLAAPSLALSSRAEVYDAGLPARAAVSLAAPVLQQGALTPADVHRRVRGRFPRGEALPDRPALDALLAPLRLEWSNDKGRYLRPDTASASLTHTRGTRGSRDGRSITASTGSPLEVEAGRFRLDLRRSLESGGFCVLQVNARDAERARRLLVRELPDLQVTSLDQAIWSRLLRRVQATPGALLDPILELERSRTPAATYGQLLDLFVRPVLDELVTDLLAAREARPQLLVHPGLLARYDARAPLDRLVRTAADHGRGAMWLLLPAYDDGAPPVIQHPDHALPVPLTRPSQSLRVPRRWLASASL